MQKKLKMFMKKFDNFRFYVRPLCELQLFAALDAYDIRHHTRTLNSCKENYNSAGRSLIRIVFVWGASSTTTPAALDVYDTRHHHSQTDPAVGTWLCLWCTLPPYFKEGALLER